MKKLIQLVLIIFLGFSYSGKSSDQDTVWKHNANDLKLEELVYFSFSYDDSLLLVSGNRKALVDDDNMLYLIESSTGKILNKYYPIYQARITPDGSYIFGLDKDSLTLLRTDSLIKVDRFHENYAPNITRVNYDFSKIYSDNGMGVGYTVWDFNTGNKIKDTTILKNDYNINHTYMIQDYKFGSNDLALFDVIEQLTDGPDNYSWFYTLCVDLKADTIKYKLNNLSLSKMGVSTEGTKFCGLVKDKDDLLNILDFNTGNLIDTMPLYSFGKAEFTHDDKYVVAYQTEPIKSIQVWDITTKELKYLYNQSDSSIYGNFEVSNTDKYIAARAYFLGDCYLYNSRWHSNGIINSAITNQLITYPNPATDFIEISVGAGSKPALTGDIKIYNIFGQTVLSVGAILELPSRVDISTLVPGLYFIRLGDKVSKFIKL